MAETSNLLFDDLNYRSMVKTPSKAHYERQIQELKEENLKLIGALKGETEIRPPSPCHIKVEDDFICLRRSSAESSLNRSINHSL